MTNSIVSHSTTAQAQKAEKKAATRKAKQKTATVNATKGARYQQFSGTGSRPYFSAYTVAQAIACGVITMTQAGRLTRSKTAKPSGITLWLKACGPTMAGHWTRSGYVHPDQITELGLNNLQTRVNGEGKFRTNPDLVRAMLKAIKAGGKQEVGGRTFDFGSSVSVKF